MIIDTDVAYSRGFNDYGHNDECPYIYEDLKGSWLSGWLAGMVACINFAVMTYND